MANKKINNNGFDYVDLGLPSGTLWATSNVGAKDPIEYGQYFQWGDTKGYYKNEIGRGEERKNFEDDWSDYKWNDTNKEIFTKYTTPGASLRKSDDAARAIMGGSWHIPSPEQIKELVDNTKCEWTAKNDVKGILFTSKKDDTKSIFIPTTGYANSGNIHCEKDVVFLQTSKLKRSSIYTCGYSKFLSGFTYFGGFYRSNGLQIRAVIG